MSGPRVRDIMISAGGFAAVAPETPVAEVLAHAAPSIWVVRTTKEVLGLVRRMDLEREEAPGRTLGECLGTRAWGITRMNAPVSIRDASIPGLGLVWYVVMDAGQVVGVLPPRLDRGYESSSLQGPFGAPSVDRVCFCCQADLPHCFSADEAQKRGLRPGTACPQGCGKVITVRNPCDEQ